MNKLRINLLLILVLLLNATGASDTEEKKRRILNNMKMALQRAGDDFLFNEVSPFRKEHDSYGGENLFVTQKKQVSKVPENTSETSKATITGKTSTTGKTDITDITDKATFDDTQPLKRESNTPFYRPTSRTDRKDDTKKQSKSKFKQTHLKSGFRPANYVDESGYDASNNNSPKRSSKMEEWKKLRNKRTSPSKELEKPQPSEKRKNILERDIVEYDPAKDEERDLMEEEAKRIRAEVWKKNPMFQKRHPAFFVTDGDEDLDEELNEYFGITDDSETETTEIGVQTDPEHVEIITDEMDNLINDKSGNINSSLFSISRDGSTNQNSSNPSLSTPTKSDSPSTTRLNELNISPSSIDAVDGGDFRDVDVEEELHVPEKMSKAPEAPEAPEAGAGAPGAIEPVASEVLEPQKKPESSSTTQGKTVSNTTAISSSKLPSENELQKPPKISIVPPKINTAPPEINTLPHTAASATLPNTTASASSPLTPNSPDSSTPLSSAPSSPTAADPDSDDPESDNSHENEELRSNLIKLQKILLTVAGVTFVVILIYAVYYISMIRKIYSKDLVSK